MPASPNLSVLPELPAPGAQAQHTLVDTLVLWAEQRIQQQVFRPGMRMPSVRQLAEERGVSRFTVVAAYERLVARGHLLARPGAGFFVREPRANPSARRKPAPARPQTVDMGWLVRNMNSGIPIGRSPGSGYLPPELCGGDLLRIGLRALAASPGTLLAGDALALGYKPLREQITARLAELEIQAGAAQVLTTTGASQAVDLVCRMLLRPGDTVLAGDPAWSNPLAALNLLGANVVPLPYTRQGLDIPALAQLAERHKPKMLLINSVLHNPTGTSLSPAAAYQVLRIAEAHDILVVEDDIYADFVPQGVGVSRLASLDQLRRVVYVSSFSKMLTPNIRVGFLAGPPDLVEALGTHKMLTALPTSEINERIVYRALTEGGYRRHCHRVQAELDLLRGPAFKRMRDLGLEAYCQPQGGFLGWFDTGVDTNLLASLGLEAGYLLAPGAIFSPTQKPSQWMRINIATSGDPEMLVWLAGTLQRLRNQDARQTAHPNWVN